MKILTSLLLSLIISIGFGQVTVIGDPYCTPGKTRLQSGMLYKEMQMQSPASPVPFRCIGPTVMSGRVVDVDVDPADPTHFYVAYASGGLWVTHNNGTTFEPLFQEEMVMTIGDIAVDWNHDETIWLGSGENNSSRSSYSGVGIFKSTDKGRTWKHMGLEESHHIGRIIIHPSDPNTIWVAALGHLYSNNTERGVYKTIDGGRTWNHSYFASDKVGAIDLVIDPVNPNELYAALWERSRKAWNFTESGKQSDVVFSNDGGSTWTSLAFPDPATRTGGTAAGIGRIGLALHHSSKGKFLYAIVDNQNHREKKDEDEEEKDELKKNDLKEMSKTDFLALDNKRLESFLRDNNFPEEHTAESVKKMVEKDELAPVALYEYLFDANSDLFDTPVIGAEVYQYDFETGKWHRTHEDYLDDLVFTYGYYFGVIRVDPNDPLKIYIAGVPLLKSEDGGKTFKGINPNNVHADHHALWIDPARPGHLVNGCDGGVQITYDDGESFVNCNTPAVGQFYAVAIDNDEPYNVYGGLQDNGVWVGSSANEPNRDWYQSGKYPFDFLLGGDGMQVEVDTRDNKTVYTGYQFGWYSRINKEKPGETGIHPVHKLREKPLRWNWQTPILLSKWNQDIFYICSNKVHRSFNKGESFETLSGDLTQGGKAGDVPYGTITTIAESEKSFGILAVGSDDGLVHLSRDAGQTWSNISQNLPANFWVSRVVLSKFNAERIYVALNGYRWDNLDAMLYVSDNSGKTWRKISSGLPLGAINAVSEDPVNENILYVGTDHGLFVTIDRGASWMVFGENLPNVPVHDLAIQERDKDVVVGTHGRSIWIGDLEEIEQMPDIKDKSLALLDLKKVRHSGGWGNNWSKWFETEDPEFHFPYYLKQASDSIEFRLMLGDTLTIVTIKAGEGKKGLNYFQYDLSISEKESKILAEALNKTKKDDEDPVKIKKAGNGKYYLAPATYVVVLNAGNLSDKKNLVIE